MEAITMLDLVWGGAAVVLVLALVASALVWAGLKALGRSLLTAGLVLLLVAPVAAQYRYTAFEQITVGATAVGFTAATINEGSGHPQATIASCRLETAQVRFTVDGTTPTTTVGTLLEIGDWLTLTSPDLLTDFRAIRTGGTSGQLNCTYYTP